MSHDLTPQYAAPKLQNVPQYIPTYKQKVGAYMRVDTNVSTSSNGQHLSYNYGLVLDATLREDSNPSPCTPQDSTHGATANIRATCFDRPRTYKRTMGMSLFHLLLSRCQAIQCIVNASECKPQTQKSILDTQKSYSRIVIFTQEAMKIAESLESVALEARCEYWAGRGYRGLQDWRAAIMHFTNATRLDSSHGNSKHPISHFEGLLPHEKEDVGFLLQDAKQRHNEWTLRTKKIQKSQDEEDSKEAGWKDMKDHLWTPNGNLGDCVTKQQVENNSKAGIRTNVFLPKDGQKVRKLWKHEIPMIRKRLSMPDGKSSFRRTLNANEWFYILRGISTAEEDNISKNDQGETEEEEEEEEEEDAGVEKDTMSSPAGSPSIYSLKQSPIEKSLNLDDELQQSGFVDGGETPPAVGSFGGMTSRDVEEDQQ
ncbi:uncharacterized protein yc1106_05991 [Curvularia clavata]|uniref:Uncharacterized protein n=1 Tax=Curvularia clavata TaxID=95742 RepID=A0A9Q8Z923_CURCL|nr:uncharacterized protein yc1106_05991 [Curvularia clavata]